MTGRAYTMICGPAANPPGTVGDYIDEVPEGHVVVIDNGGRDDATIWGDILTEIAHRRKLAGTVIDGINRDVALCRDLGYPVFSKGHWMRTGKDRVQVERMNCAVNIGGARVSPGDIMRGDADGVVVIPREHEDAYSRRRRKSMPRRTIFVRLCAAACGSTRRGSNSNITSCRPEVSDARPRLKGQRQGPLIP